MRPLVLAVAVAALAGAALADNHPRVHIYGPKGCSYFDGMAGDGAAFHALDDDHIILDHEVLESTRFSCWFDGAFSLVGAPGKVETLSGTCEAAQGGQRKASFKLIYSDKNYANLEVSHFDKPLPFQACDWP